MCVTILCEIVAEEEAIQKAVITLLGYYYLFDMAYPMLLEQGLSFFEIRRFHQKSKPILDICMTSYTGFKVKRLKN